MKIGWTAGKLARDPDLVGTVSGNSSSPDQTGNNNNRLSVNRANTYINQVLQVNSQLTGRINNAGGNGANNAGNNPNNNQVRQINSTQNARTAYTIPRQNQ